MADRPDDTPSARPSRRSGVLPPFFGPRTPAATTGEATRRRPAPLFTPPISSTPVGARPIVEAPDAQAEVTASVAQADPALAAATSATSRTAPDGAPGISTTIADSGLALEFEERIPIELSLGARHASADPEDHIQVIEYGTAAVGLGAVAREGERPTIDGMVLESTEVSFDVSDEHPTAGANLVGIETLAPDDAAAGMPNAAPRPAVTYADTAAYQADEVGERRSEWVPSALLECGAEVWAEEFPDPVPPRRPSGPLVVQPVGAELMGHSAEPEAASSTNGSDPARHELREAVADALGRIADRVRSGALPLAMGGSVPWTDAAALALALAALLHPTTGE